MKLTKAQRSALHRKYLQCPDGSPSYRAFRRRVIQGWDCIMIQWNGIWIGIETDGYTHS